MHAADRDLFRASVLMADWPAPPRVRALTSLRGPAGESSAPFDRFNLGIRCGDDIAVVERNRAALVASLDLHAAPCWLRQVHGADVIMVDASAGRNDSGEAVESVADAAVANTPGVVLAILTADCLPVLFCSEDGGAIGAAHAGWRGLAAGVLERTAAAMRIAPENVLAWLGPAAGPQAYEVGEEVRAAFVDRDPATADAFVATRPGHWLCDLYALSRRRLAGVGVARVHGGELCTISDPRRFFSYRSDARTGRMASLIWIDPTHPDA